MLASANNALDSLLPWAALIVVIGYNFRFYNRNKRKRGGFQQLIILVFIELALITFFWIFPFLLSWYSRNAQWAITTRWLFVISATITLAYFYGHENGGGRWLSSVLLHLGVVLFGWGMHRWVGILFFSLPLLLTYYSALYILAMVILPASNPEDSTERWKRFVVLASYSWGFQFPLLVVSDHAWKGAETRIKGNFTRDLPIPGLVWTKSHQVAGITGGTQFNRVDGPGVIFTGKLERPFQIVDLRTQLRSNEIDTVSKDGINFIVRVFAAFRMDPEPWDSKTYARLRTMNPLLQNAKEPSHTRGSFPFSDIRVRTALGTTSAKTGEPEKIIFWDQWALNIINEETRKVVSQRTLDEFWRPVDDERGVNAMDGIANEIKERAEWILRSKGILLVAARIVNFRFPADKKDEGDNGKNGKIKNEKDKMDEISKRQIATWGAEWERKRSQKLSDAEADAERNQQEARAYAEAQLLNSIAEALQKSDDPEHPKLRRHVIAMRYLSALQDFAHKNTPEEEEKIKELHNYLRAQ